MSDELKPCPFCGNAFPAAGYDSDTRALGRGDCITVRCRQCGAETRKFDSTTSAIAAWNTRADPAATDHAERQAYIEGTQSGWKAATMLRACKGRVRVKPLEWGPDGADGSFYASYDLSANMTAFYSIEQDDYSLARVEFGVLCHEFGVETIWKGPKADAKAAAQADYERRIRYALEPADPLDDPRVVALVEALEAMRRQFSPYPSENTEQWREEHEACEKADAALAALEDKP